MKDALGHGSDTRGGSFGDAAHQRGVNKIGAYKLGNGPGTYKFNGSRITIAQYQHGGSTKTGLVGTLGQSVSELAAIIKQHPGDDRHSQNVRQAARLELMQRPVRDRMAAGVD